MQAQAEKSRAFPSPEIGREKQHLNSRAASCIMKATSFAGVMELVDVTDSKSVGSDTVWVRVPPPAPKIPNATAFGIFTYYFFTIPSSFPRPVSGIFGKKEVIGNKE